MKDFFDALVATKPVLNPSVLPEFPLGPMVKAWVESDTYAGGDNAIESILYGKPIVKSDVDRWRTNAQFIPGCTLGGVIGPGHHRDVMVVGSIPRGDLGSLGTIKPLDGMLGDGKDVLIKALEEVGISERRWKNFYITNMVRFPRLDGGKTKTMYAEWINECKHFLAQELYLIKPRLILCLGTDSSKFFSGFPVTKAQSRVFTYDIGELHKAKVVCSLDPVKVIDNFEMRPSMISSLHLFSDLLHRRSRKTEEGSYFYIDSEEELEVVVDELIAAGHTEFSLDCEWGGGSHFYDQNSALRTVQIAWSGAEGMVVILHRQFMKEAFNPYITSAMYHLRRLLQRPGVRVIGHALCADIPWMKEYGVDLTGQIYFDTMLAGHLLEPTASHELESLAVRYIKNWTRHDFELADWMKKNKIDLNLGYSEIPDEILHPYAVKDACATFYLYQYYVKELALGRNTSLRRLFYSLVMPAIPSFVEIEMNGIYMDRERLIRMEKQYRAKFDTLLAEFRLTVGNPNFNPNSYTDKSKLVFDEHGFYPIKTTGKYPKEWLDVVARREEDKYSPAVDDETLETFAHKSPVMHKLRDICLIGTVLKNFLKSQEIDPHTGERRYMTGLIGHTKSTGCLHTRISQMLKTGRLASHDPNIMNMPNRQEPAIRAAVGPGVPIIRSGFMAEPGHLLITADYKQAEIAALAYLSGDPLLIAAVVRGDDIHSTVGRKMFNMEHLTNDEFKSQFKHLRVAAKSILFGLLYGRGAPAIAREVEKAGVSCTVDQAQQFVADFMKQFPLVAKLIQDTHKQVEELHYVETLWGRREFFYQMEADKDRILAGQKRKAFNFLIQSYVADLLRKALINLVEYRRESGMLYKLRLTVHDSIMITASNAEAERVSEIVIPECMTNRAKAPRLGFMIGTDVDVTERWDIKLPVNEFLVRGLSEEYALKYCARDKDKNPVRS